MIKIELEKKTREQGKIEEELRELEKLKEDIVSNISHELKTPLTIILPAIELALEENDREELKKLLLIAKKAAERQRVVVDNLISSISQKQTPYSSCFNAIDVGELIDRVVKNIASKAHEKNIRIESFVEKEIKLRGNESELELAFYNLLDNAVKFNKEGGKIKITARKIGRFTEICIHDTGIGIPKELQKKMFEKFFQADSGLTRKYSGVGIGLHTARGIIEAHGGTIILESEAEKGSKFTIVL